MSDKPKAPAQPVPAATVLLVRKASPQLQVFMVVRHHQIDFASGALVFPGGKVETADADQRLQGRVADAGHLDAEQRAFRVGAIREAFEECGVLLARGKGDMALLTAKRLAQLDAKWRKPLVENKATMVDMVEAEDLSLATDLMVPFSHWVTPSFMPKRFDTWFFIAQAPDDQLALHDGEESVDSVWISPDQALADLEAGKRTIIYPTRCNLMMLAESRRHDEALAMARKRPIKTVLPWIEEKGGKKWLTIDPACGYALNQAPIEGAPR